MNVNTKDKIKSIAKEEIATSCVRALKRVAEIPEDELKKFLMEELPKVFRDFATSLDITLDKLLEVKKSYYPPPPPIAPEAPPPPKEVPKKKRKKKAEAA